MLDVVEDVLLLSRAEREQGLTREHVDVERVVEAVSYTHLVTSRLHMARGRLREILKEDIE